MSVSQSMSKGGHSMFVSTVSRGQSKNKMRDAHVGPGSYDLSRHTLAGDLEGMKNPRLPGFASSAPRWEIDDDYDA